MVARELLVAVAGFSGGIHRLYRHLAEQAFGRGFQLSNRAHLIKPSRRSPTWRPPTHRTSWHPWSRSQAPGQHHSIPMSWIRSSSTRCDC